MEIAEVVDQESLEAYWSQLPIAAATYSSRRLAFLAAVRSLPLCLNEVISGRAEKQVTPMEVLSPLLFSAVYHRTAKPIFSDKLSGPEPLGIVIDRSHKLGTSDAVAAISAIGLAYDSIFEFFSSSSPFKSAASAVGYWAIASHDRVQGLISSEQIWQFVRADLTFESNQVSQGPHPVWPNQNVPKEIADQWLLAQYKLLEDKGGDWGFWVHFVERLVHGEDIYPDELINVLTSMPFGGWEEAPAKINARFGDILEIYGDEDEAERASLNFELDLETPLVEIRKAKRALIANRKTLPPTFEAITGFITLEIERLQALNYKSDNERDEAVRQIGVLNTLHEAIARLLPLVPSSDKMSDANAEQAVGLISIYVANFQEWPRENAKDIVDSSYRLALIGCTAALAPMIGVSASVAAIAGGAMFGGKKIVESIKASKDGFGAPPA